MIDYDKFHKALQHLEPQHRNYSTLDQSLPAITQEAIAESVVQRFETCWDCLWKVLKRHLNEELGLPEVPNSPKPILRLANENQLLPSPIEQWLLYANARIGTSHDYSGEKAQNALELMSQFVPDAVQIYETLSSRVWKN